MKIESNSGKTLKHNTLHTTFNFKLHVAAPPAVRGSFCSDAYTPKLTITLSFLLLRFFWFGKYIHLFRDSLVVSVVEALV